MLDEGGAYRYASLGIALLRLGCGGEKPEEVNSVHLEVLELLGGWGRSARVPSCVVDGRCKEEP